MSHFDEMDKSVEFTKFIQPMAVGFVTYVHFLLKWYYYTLIDSNFGSGRITRFSARLRLADRAGGAEVCQQVVTPVGFNDVDRRVCSRKSDFTGGGFNHPTVDGLQ